MLTLLEQQQTPSSDNREILIRLVEKHGLSEAIMLCLIDAFNLGVIVGKRAERVKN